MVVYKLQSNSHIKHCKKMNVKKHIVKRIYEKHGFKVCLSSEEGVYLPLFVRDAEGRKITPSDSNWAVVKEIHKEIMNS
jgi:hypothetical protein